MESPQTPGVLKKPPLLPGQELEVTIDRLAYGGDGVAHPHGFAVFVPRTAPGDQLLVRIETVRKRYARAVPLAWQTFSTHRMEPVCPLFSRCGGCHTQHLDPDFARTQKKAQIAESLSRLGPGSFEIHPTYSPKKFWNYRNRLTYHRSQNGNQGYVAWDNHEIIDVESCPIADEDLNILWRALRLQLKEISADIIPFVVLRKTTLGEMAVILSVTKEWNGSSLNIPGVTIWATLVEKDSRTPFGKKWKLITGGETLREKVGDVTYHLRPDLFFQVHPEVTEQVVADVVRWSSSLGERLLDLYCGAGLFGLALARAGKSVLGVEINYPAVLSAQKSAEENGLSSRAQFRGGKVETVLRKLIQQQAKFDAAIVDPPRKGLTAETLDLLFKVGPSHLCYVSCSPPTLARDLKQLAAAGYKVVSIQPYDMFPQTYHVETVVQLQK